MNFHENFKHTLFFWKIGAPEVNYTALIVLEAKSMKQIARSEFRLGGPVPKPLHGYFTGNNKFAR